MQKEEVNKLILEYVGKDKDKSNTVNSLMSEVKKLNKAFESDYDFLYELALYTSKVTNVEIIRKLKNFMKISNNVEIVKKQFSRSMKLYLATLGEEESMFVCGRTKMREIKKKDNTSFKIANILLVDKENKDANVYNINSETVWEQLEILDLYKKYGLNMVQRNGEKYVSKEPNPKELDGEITRDEIVEILKENFEEIVLTNLEEESADRDYFYIHGIAVSTVNTGKVLTIYPQTLDNMDSDELPDFSFSVVSFNEEDSVEDGDVFFALGTITKSKMPNGGYVMYPIYLVSLTEHEEEETDEEQSKSFDMNSTNTEAKEEEEDEDEEDSEEEEEEA